MDIDSKAKAMSKVSTNKLTEEAMQAYNDLAVKKADYDGLILAYDGKKITLQAKTKSKENPWDSLGAEARFLVIDIKGKLVLIYWRPTDVKPMEAMKYNSVKGGLEKELGNLKTQEINDKESLLLLLK